ncbi:Phenylacetate-CoA ligase subunit [Planctomycetales bacterium 10988]|nr:Phenylacetate-CoA ligase subunit [Planctomycetales bacterium 10988]
MMQPNDLQADSFEERLAYRQIPREQRTALQLGILNDLLEYLLPRNRFYAEKFADVKFPIRTLEEWAQAPLTTKEELQQAGEDPWNSPHLTEPIEQYIRYHQTSGTKGKPLTVLDTREDWQWWLDCWQYVLDAAEVIPEDRVFMAFSFGPFIGFWSAHDACLQRGCLVIPGGGLSTLGRLELLERNQATVVCCTPSYALHLAETAAAKGIPLADFPVRVLILAGEPGGSIPAIRERIETAWNAKVLDHSGASEAGPWGYGDLEGRGIYLNEASYLAECISLEENRPAQEGELSQLILTNLGRSGFPLLRYKSGDLVRPSWSHSETNRHLFFTGGVLGRADDMMVIRGVNIYPTAIEAILRDFPDIQEYRLIASKNGQMDELHIEIEDEQQQPERIANALQTRLSLRVQVETVPLGSLPRFEAKGRRFIDQRTS